jgi:hypothetical protein
LRGGRRIHAFDHQADTSIRGGRVPYRADRAAANGAASPTMRLDEDKQNIWTIHLDDEYHE